jgi:hypothetical protein
MKLYINTTDIGTGTLLSSSISVFFFSRRETNILKIGILIILLRIIYTSTGNTKVQVPVQVKIKPV